MAKPYQYATPICLILTLVAAVGIIFGLNTANSLTILLFLLPTILYEVYRTEGESTKFASWGLLIVFVLEILFITANISFDLAGFLGSEEEYVAGHRVPLGDIKVVSPTIMAVLSVVLFTRTRGRYTKWLAVIIFAGSFAIVYALDPTIFTRLLKLGVQEKCGFKYQWKSEDVDVPLMHEKRTGHVSLMTKEDWQEKKCIDSHIM